MKLSKDAVVGFLRERGDHAQAVQADKDLPPEIALGDVGLLEKFGIDDPHELLSKVLGGKGDSPGQQ